MTNTDDEIEVAVIGAGPAGLTAGLYAARARRRTVIFECGIVGGQIATTGTVENYPGFPDGINGLDLAMAMQQQAERFGAAVRSQEVHRVRKADPGFVLETDAGEVRARAVIVTAGAESNKLDVPGEAEYVGKGVSYCGTCDGAFFRDVPVAVVGGGDSALDEGLFITRFASKVYIVHRRDELRATAVLQERARANEKIEFVWNSVVERVNGDDFVRSVALRDTETNAASQLDVAGVFVFIGQHPNAGVLGDLVTLDRGGHVPVDLWMRTGVHGLFVAGDVRLFAAKQLVSAAGDGATAAIAAEHYLAELEG